MLNMIPSYFYHIAIDLKTVSSTYHDSRPNFLKDFQNTRGLTNGNADTRLHSPNFRITNAGQEHDRLTPKIELIEDNSSHINAGCRNDRATGPDSLTHQARDWRYGKIISQGIRMARASKDSANGFLTEDTSLHKNAVATGQGGLATQGRFEPLSSEEEELGWGVLRLYRDGQETQGLNDEPTTTKGSRVSKGNREVPPFKDEDCTTLCILAVPSYLTPSDFLGFVGEKTRDEVSHFRMIRTERSNRYMVLMKFRNGRKAREWRKEWNGKSFDGIEVHIAFPASLKGVSNVCITSPKLLMSSSFPLYHSSHHPPPQPNRHLTQQ